MRKQNDLDQRIAELTIELDNLRRQKRGGRESVRGSRVSGYEVKAKRLLAIRKLVLADPKPKTIQELLIRAKSPAGVLAAGYGNDPFKKFKHAVRRMVYGSSVSGRWDRDDEACEQIKIRRGMSAKQLAAAIIAIMQRSRDFNICGLDLGNGRVCRAPAERYRGGTRCWVHRPKLQRGVW